MNWLAFWLALGLMSFGWALLCWLADLPPRCVTCRDQIHLRTAQDFADYDGALTRTGHYLCPDCARKDTP